MSTISVEETGVTDSGWRFQVEVEEGGRTSRFRVTLSRADHTRWSGDKASPEQVVRAAFVFLLDNEPVDSILSEFDCSVIRRYFPAVDRELPRMVSAAVG